MNLPQAYHAAILHTANAQQILIENPEPKNTPTMSDSDKEIEKRAAIDRVCKLVSEVEKALCAARRMEHLVMGRREPS